MRVDILTEEEAGLAKYSGILTAGGDSPGLNAVIRGLGKAALGAYGMQVIGFRDGFRGRLVGTCLGDEPAT